jgi:TolB-like protein/Flp pilus assembly protein TadD
MSVSALLRELKRRNVLRAVILYLTSVWALSQGIAQLTPVVGAPEFSARWFLVAASLGFPFWIAFSWFYELTPEGLRRESELAHDETAARATNRGLDLWIIGALSLAVVLLLTDRFVRHDVATVPKPDIASVAEKSVAVLPLVNESGDRNTLYFSDGLSEGFINALAQFTGLKVIGRTSSFQFRGSKDPVRVIGDKLGVAHLLEGSVQRAGNTVRITAELINTKDGTTLWSERYDRPYKDLFRLQDDITNAVAAALKAKLMGGVATQSDRPPSGNLDAYNAYLEAQYHYRQLNESELKAAIDCLRRAVRIDPNYAKALSQLSIMLSTQASNFLGGADARKAYAEARTLANRAVALAPNLADAHAAQGFLTYTDGTFDWYAGEKELRRALALDPGNSEQSENLALALQTLGKLDEADALFRQAIASDPLRPTAYVGLSQDLLATGQLDEAERLLKRVRTLAPDEGGIGWTVLHTLRGNAKAAMEAAKNVQAGMWRDHAIALASQIGSNRRAADAALDSQIAKYGNSWPSQIAVTYGARRDPDNMFKWLERARASSDPGVTFLLASPFFLPYRHDPRFAQLCRELNLPLPEK